MGTGGSKFDYSSPLSLRHFNLIRCIGKGAFGKVQLVQRRRDETETLIALKYMDKEAIAIDGNVGAMLQEYKLFQTLQHPFIVNFLFAFQDEKYLYAGLQLMAGGDLKFYSEQTEFIEEHTIQIWFFECISALEYMHGESITHRDIKLDNLLLDDEGHVHISDFSLVKQYNGPNHYTVGFCGTLLYVSPEVVSGQKYRFESDTWGLACSMYELLEGHSPWYKAHSEEDLLHYQSMGAAKFTRLVSSGFDSLIMEMLIFERDKRPGRDGAIELMKHSFFDRVNWDEVFQKKLDPKCEINETPFNPTLHLEEMFLDEPSLFNHDSRYDKSEYEFSEEDLALFKEFKHFDHQDEHEIALKAVLNGMSRQEAQELRLKMRQMREHDQQSIEDMKRLNPQTKT